MQLLNKLDGYKTYIGAAIIFIAGGLHAIEIVDRQMMEALIAIGGAISVYGLRHAVSKMKK